MLIDLKGSLRDPASAADVRALLHEFRKRHDLLAAIADEIDAILEPARPVASQQALQEKTGSASVAVGSRLATSAPPVPAPTPRERLLGGLAGAAVGIIVNVAVITGGHDWHAVGDALFINGIGGAVAGAIGGKRQTVAVWALAASVVGWLVLSMLSDASFIGYGFYWVLGAGPSAILGALAAVIYLKLRWRPRAKAASA